MFVHNFDAPFNVHRGGRELIASRAETVASRTALDHPTRRRIHERVLLLPGDHYRSITKALKLSEGAARHHLRILVRSRLLYEERVDGRLRYYPRGTPSAERLRKLFQKHWKYRSLRFRVLLAVRTLREARPASIANFLDISRQLAAYHLSRLAATGKLRVVGGKYLPP